MGTIRRVEKEILVDAVRALEKSAIAHSEWADRFLTFGREYSLKCERVAEDMIKARNLLKMLLVRRFEIGMEFFVGLDDFSGRECMRSEHFFVVGRNMASGLVAMAIQLVTDSARAFRRGLEVTDDPEMCDLFVKLLQLSEEILCHWEDVLTDLEVEATFEERADFMMAK